MTMFVKSQSLISLPSFMFVGVAVSEIHDLNQNKKNFENSNFQFTTFPRHITDPFFNESYLLTPSTHKLARSLVHHKLKVIIEISLSTRIMLANQGHPYIHSTTVLCDKK